VVVFAPHPDDETFGCGGTIAKRVKDGCNVFVVFMTDGRHSHDGLVTSSAPTALEIKEMRKEEATKANGILGVPGRNLVFLDFEDKKLAENQELASEKVVSLMSSLCPSEVFFPQEREYHSDHRVTNLVVKSASVSSGLHPIERRYIIAWSFPLCLYRRMMPEHLFDRVSCKTLGRKLIAVDICEFSQLKNSAMREYKSQVSTIFEGQRRAVLKYSLVKSFMKTTEKFF
jgi:N-acetylglucosamine malate deacetylase 1